MKQFLRHIFLLVAMLVATANLSAQTYNGRTWYSLYDANGFKLETKITSFNGVQAYRDVFAPVGGNLTFNWQYSGRVFPSHDTYIYESSDGGSNYSGEKGHISGTGSGTGNVSLSANINKIKFDRPTGNTNTVKYTNIKLPLKKHILLADGGYGKEEESKSFGNVTIGNVSARQTVKLRSFLTTNNITITSNNPAFRVGDPSNQGAHVFNVGANACASANGTSGTPASGGTLGDINLYDINIYFVPTSAGEHSGTITITDGTSTATIFVSGTGLAKQTNFAWAIANTGQNTGEYLVEDAAKLYDIYTLTDLNGDDVKNILHDYITFTSDEPSVVAIENEQLIAKNAGVATITATFNEHEGWAAFAEKTITLTIKKHEPVFTWNLSVHHNSVVNDFFSTTGGNALSYSSSDEEVATISQGTTERKLSLKTYNKKASTDITVTQAEDYYWYEHTETRTITPTNPSNHVPFDLDENNKNTFQIDDEKLEKYSDRTIQLSNTNGGFDWDDKYVIIEFSGIPNTITFSTSAQTGATSKYDSSLTDYGDIFFYIDEGLKDGTWLEKRWSSYEVTNTVEWKLSPDTRKIKLCYSGNLTGYFHDVTVTELDQFVAIDAEENMVTAIDFGDEVHVDTKQTRQFNFQYANVGYKVKFEVVSDSPENAAIAKQYITFSHEDLVTIDGEKYLTSIGGEQCGTINNIAVQFYSASDEYSIPANTQIKISDEIGHVRYISLSGEIKRADQVLTWQGLFLKDPVMLPLSTGTFTDVAKSSNEDMPITYESNNPAVIAVSEDGKYLTPIAEGEVVITANQAGNHIYNPANPITKSVVVTGKTVQIIIWESNLSDLQVGDAPVTLVAKAYWIDMDNGAQLVYSEGQTSKIQFSSQDPSIVSIEGNLLTIHAPGSTTVTAYLPGDDDTYKEDQQSIPVRVQPATTWCDDILLLNHSDEYEFFKFDLAMPELISDVYTIDHTKGVPGTLEFQHTGKPWTLAIEYYGGSIQAQQSVDGTTWTTIATVTPTKNATNISEGNVLDRKAKYIRFVRPQGGVGYHYISNVKVYPANYIETSIAEIDFGTVQFGSENKFSFEVAYSNIKYQISPKVNESDVAIAPSTFGYCSAFGTQTITGTWTPIHGGDNITRTITFTDVNTGMSASVVLKANVLRKEQYIKWDDAPAEIDDYIDIDSRPRKTLNASNEEVRDITYEIINGTDLAAFDNGMFYIKGTGDIRIRAYHNGDAEYKPVKLIKDIKITSMSPTFVGTNSQDWATSSNWVNSIKPTDTDDFALILAPVTIAEEVSANGLQIASGGTVHISAKGGLTLGERGVVSATDVTKIIIDNTPEGAGFLRVDPTTDNKPAKVTVNYTTRAKSGDANEQVWQYVGAPGENPIMSSTENAKIYYWSETEGWVKHATAFEPFKGYAISQKNNANDTYTIAATPIFDNHTIELTKTSDGMNGDNLFVNSYLAPIDLTKFTDYDDALNNPDDDFIGDFEKTFYLFNSGSLKDCYNNGGKGSEQLKNGSAPGQYYAITPLGAALLDQKLEQTTIPPMQGVYVVANESGAKIRLDYNKHVYKAQPNDLNRPMRAPQEEEEDFVRVRLQVNSENSGADRMYIIQYQNTTRGYDNGYDAKNIIAQGQPNIYTNEVEGQMEISVADQIDSTYIGFTAGEDSQYTLTFTSLVGEEIYFHDLETDSLFSLTEGGQYVFSAQPNSVDDMRFLLLLNDRADDTSNGGVVTGVDNIISPARLWVNDKRVYIADVPQNSTLAVYTISGMSITSPLTIHYAPCTIDLSHLPTGVYVLRLNNQAYKFVCK